MNILIIGSGGREHTLAWKIAQSPQVEKLYCAPGNGGIADIAECVDINVNDFTSLIKFAKENKIDLTVVGPEAPLVDGIVDAFEEEDLAVFGPNKDAALLEGSKIFTKEFLKKWNIPTAPFVSFDRIDDALDFLNKAEYPLVVKADGLAAGKGVIICKEEDEAKAAIKNIMEERVFEDAGNRVLIEQCLHGEEVSILAISDGENYVMLDSSQDHKRIFDGDLGPNTGGMGAYSPAPIADPELMKKIEARVIEPTIRGMRQDNRPFRGVLYAGLMITTDGPMVLEYNVRFGDPEAQALLPRLKNDLVELMFASVEGQLNDVQLVWDNRDCVCVVITSGGYPGKYEKGKEIKGLNKAAKAEDTFVFHAGTKKESNKYVTSGGRVLGVTSLGEGIEDAIDKVYLAVDAIKFDRCFFRRDIAARALRKSNAVSR